MRENITIGEEIYELATNAYTPIAYKEQFGKDYFQDLFSMVKNQAILNELENDKEVNSQKVDLSLLSDFDMTFFHRLFWVFAKSANPRIQPFTDFFMNMEEFPIQEVAPVLMKMLNQGMTTRKKSMKLNQQVMKSLQ